MDCPQRFPIWSGCLDPEIADGIYDVHDFRTWEFLKRDPEDPGVAITPLKSQDQSEAALRRTKVLH